jgi:tetratricopeptide (TPR) repeat protein
MPHRHYFRCANLVAVLLLTTANALSAAPPSETAQELLGQGEAQLREGKADKAVQIFERAAKLGGADCFDCALGLARAYRQAGAYQDALEQGGKALNLGGSKAGLAIAHSEMGLAQLGLQKKGDPEKATEHFQTALELAEGKVPALYFNLGVSLLRRGQDEEGITALQEFLKHEPRPDQAYEAEALIEDPRRAREERLPAFSTVSLDGRFLSSKKLEGTVVLFDFWATWCGPCRKALPNLRRLNKKMEGSPFELVSVSADQEEAVVREFVEKEEMAWTQVHDQSKKLTNWAFKVRSYPTYVLVDHEGNVIFRRSGWSPTIDMEVSRHVKRALKRAHVGEDGR